MIIEYKKCRMKKIILIETFSFLNLKGILPVSIVPKYGSFFSRKKNLKSTFISRATYKSSQHISTNILRTIIRYKDNIIKKNFYDLIMPDNAVSGTGLYWDFKHPPNQ